MIERRNLSTAVPKPINYCRFWDMIIVCYDTVKYLQLCVRNQTPGVRLRSALPVLCNLYLVPRKDITVTQVFYSIIIYIILIILYYINYIILYYILCQKQTSQCPCQPIKEGQYRHLTMSAVNKPGVLN